MFERKGHIYGASQNCFKPFLFALLYSSPPLFDTVSYLSLIHI